MTKTMMKINNKAQSQMWWIIMAAVIALIVAVVLLLMFSRGTGKVESGLSACETAGGTCLSVSKAVILLQLRCLNVQIQKNAA